MKCRECNHAERRWRRGLGGKIKKKIVCKVSGSHLPWDHEVGHCRYFDPHVQHNPRVRPKPDPQTRLF